MSYEIFGIKARNVEQEKVFEALTDPKIDLVFLKAIKKRIWSI